MSTFKVTIKRNGIADTFLVLATNKVHASELVAHHEGIRLSNGYEVKASKYNGYSKLPTNTQMI